MIKTLLYHERGFNPDYPLAFMTSARCFMLQTTELSYDGTPRYCPNPNAEGTYWIKWFYDKKMTPIWKEEDMEMISGLKELGL